MSADASSVGDIKDRFELQPADSDGDGTVPHESGLAPGKLGGVIERFSLKGFDHQGAYMPQVQDVMADTRL